MIESTHSNIHMYELHMNSRYFWVAAEHQAQAIERVQDAFCVDDPEVAINIRMMRLDEHLDNADEDGTITHSTTVAEWLQREPGLCWQEQ